MRAAGWSLPLAAAAALALLIMSLGPLATNDGPVHMSFAKLMAQGSAGPLQDAVYHVRPALDPNMLAYPVAGALIPLIGADAAESAVQLACLLGLPLAGVFALRQIAPGKEAAAALIGAFALNQMFFLGLYNYVLSISAFLLVCGFTVRAWRSGGLWWTGLSAALVLAFFAHAAGFLMSVAFIGAWSLPGVLAALRRAGPLAAVSASAWVAGAMTPALLLALAYALRQDGETIDYGIGLLSRLRALGGLRLIAAHGLVTKIAAWMVAAAIVAGCALALRRRLKDWSAAPGGRVETWRWGLVLAGCAAAALLMPDTAGGGWTHFRRTIPFPYIAGVLFIAATLPRRTAVALGVGGCAMVLLQAGAAAVDQSRVLPARAAIDRLLTHVDPGCTVLPLIPEPLPMTPAGARPAMTYEPLFHAATRLEQTGDRAALFSYLARLTVYPVEYRVGRDPQALIFGWRPAQQDTLVTQADVPGWERVTGLRVDHLLVQGDPARLPPGLRPALAGYAMAAADPSWGLSLWRRSWGSRCGAETVLAGS